MRKPFLLLLALLSLHFAVAQRTLLIKNINIVDVEKGTLLKQAQVLIRDSVIQQIATKGLLKADTTIDADGRYLIPGLWDMHTHVWMENPFFPLLTTNGVTGIRGMFDQMPFVNAWRKGISEGRIAGPAIYTSGPIVDGEKPMWQGSVAVSNADQGRRAVDSLKNTLHTDFIKVYSLLTRDAYFAIAEEAKKQQISFAGHVPDAVTLLEAAQAGQKSQEHLFGFLEAASDSADYYMQVLQKKIIDSNLVSMTQRKQFLLRTYNASKLQTVLKQVAKTDTWICPTIQVNYSMSHFSDTTLNNDPRILYVSKIISGPWKSQQATRGKSVPAEGQLALQKEFDLKLTIVKAIYDAGIPIISGTDFPNPYCLPGFGLHDELQWLVKAGLTPAQALQTVTINAARFLNWQQKYGTIAPGKIADLVLLNANPLIDIKNTTTINAVILHGKVINQQSIAAIQENLKKKSGY